MPIKLKKKSCRMKRANHKQMGFWEDGTGVLETRFCLLILEQKYVSVPPRNPVGRIVVSEQTFESSVSNTRTNRKCLEKEDEKVSKVSDIKYTGVNVTLKEILRALCFGLTSKQLRGHHTCR